MNRKLIFLTVAAAIGLAGCKKADTTPPDTSVYCLATYESTDAETNVSLFTFQAIDDSPVISLTAVWKPTEGFEPGTRVLLAYTSETPGESGPITLKGVAKIIGGKPEVTATPSTGTVSLRPVTIWRSGDYLNVRTMLSIASGQVTAILELDEASEGTARPAYYINVTQPTSAGIETTMRETYFSWDIADQWNQATTQGVTLYYRDTAGRVAELNEINK